MNAHHQEIADVYVEDGIIVAVQSNLKVIIIINLLFNPDFWGCAVCEFL